MLNWRNNQGVFHLIYSTRCDAWRLFLMAAALWWGSSWGISNAQEPPEACIDMGITPSSPRAGRNVTLTANCSTADAGYYLTEYFWTFSDDPSASITTLDPSVTRIFASAGTYWAQLRVRDTGNSLSAYSQRKKFNIVSNEYTIIVAPSAGGMVLGDGIACAQGASAALCQKTYAMGQHAHLKAIPDAGRAFLGWKLGNATLKKQRIEAQGNMTIQAMFDTVAVDLSIENSLTACMEGRYVTFAAAVSSNVPTPITFVFQYQRPDGTTWTDADWSLDAVEYNTRRMEPVPAGDIDHFYATSTLVSAVQEGLGLHLTSNIVPLDVHTLWIDEVGDAATGKAWKAVVGDPINYRASASPDCVNWRWEMPDTPDGWVFGRRWNPTGGEASSTDSGGTPLLIPERDLPFDAEWDQFGERYGRVRVSCEASDGNRYARDSTDQTPARRVQVFFDPSDKTPHAGLLQPSHEIPKNFFYYWLAALGNFPHVFWDDYHHALASTSPVTGEIFIGDLGNSYEIESSEIRLQKRLNYIGGTCPALYEFNGCPIYVRPGDGKKKIDLFLAVLSHELQHRSDAINNYLIPAANCELPHPDDVDNDCLKNAADPFPNMVNGVGYWE